MFTGLVQSLGTVQSCVPDGHGGRDIVVREPKIAPLLTLGESVAVSGTCLTVVAFDAETFRFQVGPETVNLTTLGQLKPGDPVNLERSLRMGDPLGGHFVTGHVDTAGTILQRQSDGEWEIATFEYPPEFDDLLVAKGSIAVDGVSLTVVDGEQGKFWVMLIPHTLTATTLGSKKVGDAVNLEFDLLAKHVRKMLKPMVIRL